MSERIAFSDIKVGDKIEITDVQVIDIEQIDGRYINDSMPETLHGWERTFTLIERPLPPLPTKIGSVIEIDDQRLFLRNSSAYEQGLWQGTRSDVELYSHAEVQKIAEAHGGFEVLL